MCFCFGAQDAFTGELLWAGQPGLPCPSCRNLLSIYLKYIPGDDLRVLGVRGLSRHAASLRRMADRPFHGACAAGQNRPAGGGSAPCAAASCAAPGRASGVCTLARTCLPAVWGALCPRKRQSITATCTFAGNCQRHSSWGLSRRGASHRRLCCSTSACLSSGPCDCPGFGWGRALCVCTDCKHGHHQLQSGAGISRDAGHFGKCCITFARSHALSAAHAHAVRLCAGN